jgi:demethylsterigmatocystin 6-O-methyltransferase
MPAWAKMSEWLQAQKDSSNRPTRLPVGIAYTGDMPWFAYIAQPEHADLLSHAAHCMAHWKEGTPDWFSAYPVDREGADLDDTAILFVDVGGGLGHQCQSLRLKKPHLKGRVILEDRPEVVRSAPKIEGVEFVEQDFLQTQAIRGMWLARLLQNHSHDVGAKFYYLRWVLHDWQDDDCVKILTNLKAAMTPDSRILIDEMVIPDTGCHRDSANLDVVMMTLFGATERTRGQWVKIFERAGLVLKRVFPYGTHMGESILELETAEYQN